MSIPLAIIATGTAFIVLATLLPLSSSPKWWIRGLDFPRLQITVLGSFLLAIQTLLMDASAPSVQVLAAATASCLLFQAWWILPYTRLYPKEVKSFAGDAASARIRIMTANVLAPNRNAESLIALIRQYQPDIFVTLESNHWWQAKLDVLEEEYLHTIKCPLQNLYGMHVYSKLLLKDSTIQFLVEPDIPSMHTSVILRSGQSVRMHFLHPAPPSPTENEESTQRDAELLIVAKSIAGLDAPIIVAGDLNDVAWSATTRLFRKLSGLLDPRIGRGMFNTFHAEYWFMRWPLDHLFHSRHFSLSFIKRLPAFGSDHFPVLVELVYDEAAGSQQKGLAADASDKAAAQEKIAEAAVQETHAHESERKD